MCSLAFRVPGGSVSIQYNGGFLYDNVDNYTLSLKCEMSMCSLAFRVRGGSVVYSIYIYVIIEISNIHVFVSFSCPWGQCTV